MGSENPDKSAKKLAKKAAKAQLSLNSSTQHNQTESNEQRKRRRGIEKEDKRKRKEDKLERRKKKEQKNLEKEQKKSKKEEKKMKTADKSRGESSPNEDEDGDQMTGQEDWLERSAEQSIQADEQGEWSAGEKKKKDEGKGKEKEEEMDRGRKSKSKSGNDATAAASKSNRIDVHENLDTLVSRSHPIRPNPASEEASNQATSRPQKRSKTSGTASNSRKKSNSSNSKASTEKDTGSKKRRKRGEAGDESQDDELDKSDSANEKKTQKPEVKKRKIRWNRKIDDLILIERLVSTQSLAIKRSDEKAIVWRELNRSPNWFWTRDNLRGHWVQIQDRYLPLDFEGTLKEKIGLLKEAIEDPVKGAELSKQSKSGLASQSRARSKTSSQAAQRSRKREGTVVIDMIDSDEEELEVAPVQRQVTVEKEK